MHDYIVKARILNKIFNHFSGIGENEPKNISQPKE